MSRFKEAISGGIVKEFTKAGGDFAFAYKLAKKTSSAFTGATGDSHGDTAGTGNPYTLFTVTGNVMMHVFGICNVAPTGATGTIEVGVTGNTAALIAQEVGTDIAINGIFVGATQALGAARLVGQPFIVSGGLDVIETVGTADITAGQIDYYCLWLPLDANASVKAA